MKVIIYVLSIPQIALLIKNLVEFQNKTNQLFVIHQNYFASHQNF